MKTLAQEALEILEPIPDEKWTTGQYAADENGELCCTMGHWNMAHGGNPYYCLTGDEDELRFMEACKKYLSSKGYNYIGVIDVNDNIPGQPYSEPTPKARVIHLLKDMVEAGL